MMEWIGNALRRGLDGVVAGWRRRREAASGAARNERITEALAGLDARLLADLGVTRTGAAIPSAEAPPRQRRQTRTRPPIISAQPRMRHGSAVCWANPTQPKWSSTTEVMMAAVTVMPVNTAAPSRSESSVPAS